MILKNGQTLTTFSVYITKILKNVKPFFKILVERVKLNFKIFFLLILRNSREQSFCRTFEVSRTVFLWDIWSLENSFSVGHLKTAASVIIFMLILLSSKKHLPYYWLLIYWKKWKMGLLIPNKLYKLFDKQSWCVLIFWDRKVVDIS